nr:hypothetical protein [Marinobacterium jannaschii]
MARARFEQVSLPDTPYYHCIPDVFAVLSCAARIGFRVNPTNIDGSGFLTGRKAGRKGHPPKFTDGVD